MRKAEIAQWILSRSTTPDRAESTIGDLLEQAPSRTGIWFWNSILQVALAGTLTRTVRTVRPLLPLLVDTTVFTLLIWEFVGKGWRGFLYQLIGILIWGVLYDKLLRWPHVPGHGMVRFGWSMVLVTTLLLLHVGV